MAQTWHAVPLLATSDTLSDSRGYINDAFAALRSSFSGSTAPSSPVEGQPFYDTDTNILSIYNGAAWIVIGDIDNGAYLGLLPRTATSSYPLSGDLYLGSNQIKAVADPSADQDAATRKYCTDTFLPLSGGTMTDDLVMGANDVTSTQDPAGATSLTRKSYVDAQVLGGGTYTDDIDMDGNEVIGLPASPSATGASSKEYVDGQFHATTGHDHDGTDSKLVNADHLDTGTAFNTGDFLCVAASGVGFDAASIKGDLNFNEYTEVTSSWTTLCTITFTTSRDGQKILLFGMGRANIISSDEADYRITSAGTPVITVDCDDSNDRTFQLGATVTITTAASTTWLLQSQKPSTNERPTFYSNDNILIALEVGT